MEGEEAMEPTAESVARYLGEPMKQPAERLVKRTDEQEHEQEA